MSGLPTLAPSPAAVSCPPRQKPLGKNGRPRSQIVLDLHEQSDEVRTARVVALEEPNPALREPVRVFRSTAELRAYLRAHPDEEFSTLIISGHYVVNTFTSSDGISSQDFDDLVQQYPGLRSITGMTALGCYPGLTANAWDWASAMPNLRYLASFALRAPSDTPSTPGQRSNWLPSSEYLRRIEHARGCLEKPGLTLEEQQKVVHPLFKYKNTQLAGAVITFDVTSDPKNPHTYMQPTSTFEKDRRITDSDVICADAAKDIESLLQTKFNEFGSRPRTVGDVTKLYRLEQYGGRHVPIPQDDNYSKLRVLYANVQLARICSPKFYATDPTLRKVFGGPVDESVIFRHLADIIMLIHGDLITKNAFTCAPKFWTALANRLERCGLASASTIADLRAHKAPLRTTLWQATQAYWKGIEAENTDGYRPLPLDVDTFRYCAQILNFEDMPAEFFDPLTATSPVCQQLKAQSLAPYLQQDGCNRGTPPPAEPRGGSHAADENSGPPVPGDSAGSGD
jgi:hypothetical protein